MIDKQRFVGATLRAPFTFNLATALCAAALSQLGSAQVPPPTILEIETVRGSCARDWSAACS
jgi:hypothetical protein